MAAPQKTIVISDIHMSDGEPYSWFQGPYPGYVTDMLNKFTPDADSNVKELVLLGDVFDLWLYPLHVIPWTIRRIIEFKANRSVTEALKRCVQEIRNVYYLTGNHDMGVVGRDLDPFISGGRKIQLISPKEYSAKYGGRRHLEHGHGVDMFNAPDDSQDTIGGYPLGFFITRLVATAADPKAAWRKLNKLLREQEAAYMAMEPAALLAAPHLGPLLVEMIIDLLEDHAGVEDSTIIRFSEPALDSQRYTVGDIKSHYGSLFGTWLARWYPNIEDFVSTMLVSVLPHGLDWYAEKLLSGGAAPQVVLMGHTHAAGSRGGYNNDGCWCNSNKLDRGDATPHYVEIFEVDGLDTVRLVTWP